MKAMELAKNLLSKIPKNTLVLLLIFMTGLFFFVVGIYLKEKIKQNEDRQITILNGQKLMVTNQNIITKEMKNGFLELRTSMGEIKLKQNVIIETLPGMSKKACKQIQNIYEQMREDQSRKDRNKMDAKNESYIEPIEPVDPIFPLLVNNKK